MHKHVYGFRPIPVSCHLLRSRLVYDVRRDLYIMHVSEIIECFPALKIRAFALFLNSTVYVGVSQAASSCSELPGVAGLQVLTRADLGRPASQLSHVSYCKTSWARPPNFLCVVQCYFSQPDYVFTCRLLDYSLSLNTCCLP